MWKLESCKEKCAKDSNCKGFNYDSNRGLCRYKKSLSNAKTIPKQGHNCWIYNRDGTTQTVLTTTTSAFQFPWLVETQHDCASPDFSQNLRIGDTISESGHRHTYDHTTVDKCKLKSAK